MIEKHLYQRTLTDPKTGKPLKAWYYWYYHDGKKVRKSCGQYRRPCLLKRDAQAYLARLNDSLLIPCIPEHITRMEVKPSWLDIVVFASPKLHQSVVYVQDFRNIR